MKRYIKVNKILSLLFVFCFIFAMTGCIKKEPEIATTEAPTESQLPQTVRITFPEGYTYNQIKNLLIENNVCTKEELDDAQNAQYDYKFFNDDSKNEQIIYNLEGYLFPDTYDFYIDENPQSVFKRFLDNLNNKLKTEYYDRAEDLGMSMHEILTLASIIQKESSVTSEMKNVSSVFHNRLKINMRLQTDVTVWYPYHKKSDVPEDIIATFKSDYNTSSINGLPPGPICNPGLPAIEAALYPAETDYCFFVSGTDGKYYYAKTYDEHKANCKIALG
jgi:UPF0755 protein